MPRLRWWKLPPHHPLRIHHEFTQAAAHRRRLRRELSAANDEPSQWEIEIEEQFPGIDVRDVPTPKQLQRAEERYTAAHALWMAAGCPNNEGKRTQPKKRKELADLLAARGKQRVAEAP